MTANKKHGFTLIELSIVLVIIGLIVGGVLVGRDLIKSAEIRSQISQINEFTVAVNNFKVKYGYLPGDMPPDEAKALGFFEFQNADRGRNQGFYAYGNNDGSINYWVELYPFWSHLSDAKMIKGSYGGTNGDLLNSTTVSAGYPTIALNTAGLTRLLPKSKLGGASAFVRIVGNHPFTANTTYVFYGNTQKVNIFTITDRFSTFEFYSIDSKIDDGMPATGNIRDRMTRDTGSGNFFDDSSSHCTTNYSIVDKGLGQTYDLNPATANNKNCRIMDFLF